MHLAAESHVDRSIDGPGEFIKTNTGGTSTLLQKSLHYWRMLDVARRKLFRFLHVSTPTEESPTRLTRRILQVVCQTAFAAPSPQKKAANEAAFFNGNRGSANQASRKAGFDFLR